ncbi:uncharacterized protein LOC129568143 [Sitodiplosis mosellana]|uniref:uncharacterized protein LOC129568143 n=1 Tax=Sitodiplosis mosellana TaxID=263140 RepID=UPI002444775E|nr:uncharacterized protein LOC129568143 [Sitodiplosis mosellana]
MFFFVYFVGCRSQQKPYSIGLFNQNQRRKKYTKKIDKLEKKLHKKNVNDHKNKINCKETKQEIYKLKCSDYLSLASRMFAEGKRSECNENILVRLKGMSNE